MLPPGMPAREWDPTLCTKAGARELPAVIVDRVLNP